MVTVLSYDWKEQPTIEKFNKALNPHNLRVLSFDNGDSYDWIIASIDSTTDQIVDAIIDVAGFEPSENESEFQLREELAGMLVSE